MTALVVLSGGQDSTTCLFQAIADHGVDGVCAVSINYGQRHAVELEAAQRIAALAGVPHEVIELPASSLHGRSFLTDKTASVETFESIDAMTHHNAFKENKLDSSFVPARNMLFLTLALNRAAVRGCTAVYIGVTAADFAEYGKFSWEWLGGFLDAQGFLARKNDKAVLDICEDDPELVHRIGAWLRTEEPTLHYAISVHKGRPPQLTMGMQNLCAILPQLMPHVHSAKRREQLGRFDCEYPEVALTDAYVAGLWEGNGNFGADYATISMSASGGDEYEMRVADFYIYHQDEVLLQRVRDYIGEGYNYVGKAYVELGCATLKLPDAPKSSQLASRLRPHLNVLRSFENLAKGLHNIDMIAGGFNPPYSDCTPDFIYTMQHAFREALLAPSQEEIAILTPVMFRTKAQSVQLARELPGCWEALAYSHTCYQGDVPPCGKCHACLLRAKGFAEAGETDPLQERLAELVV